MPNNNGLLPKIKGKFGAFFISTLFLSTIYPFFLNSKSGIILLHILITSVLVTGIQLVSYQRKLFWIGSVWGLIAILLTWLVVFQANKSVSIAWSLCLLCFYSFITICTLVLVSKSQRVTLDTILGAISGYLAIAITWAMLFYYLELVEPGSFNLPKGTQPTPDIFIYFSHITISSVGYGDITPATPLARSFTALLGITGQLYLAVLIGILIGIYLSHDSSH